MKLNIKTIATLCFITALIIPSLTYAQPGFDDNVNDVPIDGGLSLLVAAGIGYGANKIRNNRNTKK